MQRLPNTPKGETESIGFRLPPPLLAMIDREVDTLRAAAPGGVSVTRSTALRALLVELEQRRAADPSRAPTGDGREGERIAAAAAEVRRILAEMDTAGAELRALLEGAPGAGVQRVAEEPRGAEGPRAGGERAQRRQPVAHTAAGGQLSLLTRTANDGAQHRPHRATNTASAAENSPASAEVLAALKPRLEAAIASSSAKAIARGAGVDAASLTRWLSGARPGVSVGTARKLGEYLASSGG
jgi:hypothetical protein